MKLTKDNLAEAELDLRVMRDPAWGGFNLLYGDNYFAKGLAEKWGMSLEELDKEIKALKGATEVHQEPVEFAHCPAESCVLCDKPTRTWMDPHTPVCRECARKPDSKEKLDLMKAQKKAAKDVIDKVLIDEAKRGLERKTARCQEADIFMSVSRYVPCGKTGHAVVWSDRDDRPYVMCEACADHAVRSRGMKLIAKMQEEVPQA